MSFDTKSLARNVVTPVTAVTFLVSTVTGVMLLAHWNAGLVRFSHEWLSMVFSAIALWHLARNWRAFMQYFRRHAALAALVLSLVASLAFTGMTGTTSNVSPRAVFRALSGATLERAAPAFGMAPGDAVALLKSANVEAAADETLNAIGTRAGIGGAGVASLLAAKGAR